MQMVFISLIVTAAALYIARLNAAHQPDTPPSVIFEMTSEGPSYGL